VSTPVPFHRFIMICIGWLGSVLVEPVTEYLSTPSTYQLMAPGCHSMAYVW
jgi:hypothetical protein